MMCQLVIGREFFPLYTLLLHSFSSCIAISCQLTLSHAEGLLALKYDSSLLS